VPQFSRSSSILNDQLVKKCPTFNETWRFITIFTKALHFSLTWEGEENIKNVNK
jgi:hypothetical protein